LVSIKKQLVAQFLAESLVLTFFAIIIAFAIVFFLLPYFNHLSGKSTSFSSFFTIRSIIAVLILGLLAGTLAGIYPAFFLSSFNVIAVLKNKSLNNGRKSLLRSGLVVFQFTVSTGLIIATLVVYRQLHYMQDKKLGYDKEQLLFVQDTYMLGNRDVRKAFKEQLVQDSRIVRASIGTDVPGNPFMDGTQAYAKDRSVDENGSEIHINIYHVDYDYIPTMGLQIIKGRNFSPDFGTDSAGVIINEAAARELGWGNTNPIGKTIVSSGQHAHTVIGMVKDFHYTSVKQKIAPLMIAPGNMRSGLIVKIKTADVQNLLTDIKKQWNGFSPGAPFTYYFVDDKFAALYTAEQKTGQIFTAFSLVAIVIAGLGLFGLATFITEQRTREIGIRKVFGASVQQVLLLVSKEFIILVAIAFVIAVPVTWWGMHQWLQDFAYRVTISWWVFAVAGIMALVIALLTVSIQAIKAAIANPVKSLRAE
jgi:putative ABC transport system permease protein